MPKVVTQRCLEQDLNPEPTDRKPKCITVTPPRHPVGRLPKTKLKLWRQSRGAHLRSEGDGEDGDEERIAVHAGEDVVLAVHLARADLVEERHHDERVEDDREVLVRRLVVAHVAAAVDVQQVLACIARPQRH